MKKIDGFAALTIYQENKGKWTFPATNRGYKTATGAAEAARKCAELISAQAEEQAKDAALRDENGVYFGNHGEISATVAEIGSLLDVLRDPA